LNSITFGPHTSFEPNSRKDILELIASFAQKGVSIVLPNSLSLPSPPPIAPKNNDALVRLGGVFVERYARLVILRAWCTSAMTPERFDQEVIGSIRVAYGSMIQATSKTYFANFPKFIAQLDAHDSDAHFRIQLAKYVSGTLSLSEMARDALAMGMESSLDLDLLEECMREEEKVNVALEMAMGILFARGDISKEDLPAMRFSQRDFIEQTIRLMKDAHASDFNMEQIAKTHSIASQNEAMHPLHFGYSVLRPDEAPRMPHRSEHVAKMENGSPEDLGQILDIVSASQVHAREAKEDANNPKRDAAWLKNHLEPPLTLGHGFLPWTAFAPGPIPGTNTLAHAMFSGKFNMDYSSRVNLVYMHSNMRRAFLKQSTLKNGEFTSA
jgi:hypothetical protein